MDLYRDELRRQMRELDAANKAAMPKWREALTRIFSGEGHLTRDEKAAVLGVPSPGRRQLFKIGGMTFIGAAVLAACGDDDEPESTGTTAAPTTEPPAEAGGMDLALARTAASLEILAVETYTTGIESGLVSTQAIADAAMLFRDHHQEHADALNGVVTSAGGEEVAEANQAVFDALIKPAVDAATTEADIAQLALDLENAAAQTYVFAGGELSTPELRSTIMTIGGIEARHAAILQMVALGGSPLDVFPDERAFFPGDNPLAGIDGAVLA